MEVSADQKRKPHAMFIPYPLQGHITPMMQLAKLIHQRGFHVTFVNTEYNHQRLVQSGSHDPDLSRIISGFNFETIPDGLSTATPDRSQDVSDLCNSLAKNSSNLFRHLIMSMLNESPENPPITCIVSDASMSLLILNPAEDLGVPVIFFRPHSGCGFWCYFHFKNLIEKGYIPLQDECQLKNGYLETKIDWIPGMPALRLMDMPTFLRTLDPHDTILNYIEDAAQATFKGKGLIINTFAELEPNILSAARCRVPNLFAVGPLLKQCQKLGNSNTDLSSIKSSLWKEDDLCLAWLDKQRPESVVYVNFGSSTVLTPQQLVEFAWGVANCKHPFLWVIRPDLVEGQGSVLPPEFRAETEERGFLASWCPQERVLSHPSIGPFLTHCGWNSILESICAGVPMLCWPFFAEQPTNCRYACDNWGIGVEIEGEVKRGEVERLIRLVMEGEKGKEMRERAKRLKHEAEKAVQPGGSSYCDLERLLNEVLDPQ
ncbi:(R)-mandelonitrile beta-glucosyltransferase-like [Nymphaea colorata]|nr:(R)-mandelonitrile beta-glucosyltransferase-like [Nymphaea colorata]